MEKQNLVRQFDELINYSLYNKCIFDDAHRNILDTIKIYLEKSNNIIDDVAYFCSNQTPNNSFQYIKLINEIIKEASLSFEQIIKLISNNNFSLIAIMKLNEKQFINYISSKTKYTSEDIKNINYYLRRKPHVNKLLFSNKELINKLPNNSLEINNYSNIGKIPIDELRKINGKYINSYLLFFYNDFNEFIQFITLNDDIWTLINDNSLIFDTKYDQDVIKYIENNKNTITKFNSYYLKLLNNDDILKCFNNGFCNSYILKIMYENNIERVNDIYSVKNILKCSNNSITYFPYNELDITYINEILNNTNLLLKFDEYIIAQMINDLLNEEDRINLLRKDEFIQNMSSYTIELIVNNLSFKSLFNMIQNNNILNRIENLNTKLSINDKVFVRGFLDSTSLINKSSKEMIIRLLLLIDSDKVLSYLQLPYILNKLSSNDIISIIEKQYIDFNNVIDNENIINKLSSVSIVNYINSLWKDKIDLSIISRTIILKKIFNLSDTLLDKINIDEVNYLFEAIRTKDVLSIQDKRYTVMTYRAVIASYLCLGINKTLELINEGNNDIDLDDTKNVLNSIVYHKLLEFRNNNYSILQNIDKKIVDNLKNIEFNSDVDIFTKELLFNGYISSIISLMVSTEYSTLFEIVNILYNYKQYDKDENARKELKDFCSAFSTYCINKKKREFINKLEVKSRRDYDLKKTIKCSEFSKISTEYLNKLKLKIFIKVLLDDNKDNYKYAFRDNTDINTIKDKYIKYLSNNNIDIDSIIKYILIPLSKDKFDEINCLDNIGIKKPKDYDLYIRNISDINSVNEINCFISSIKNDYDISVLIEILNYICHGSTIKSKIDRRHKNIIKELQFKAFEVLGEMYVDITTCSLIYTNTIDIEDENEIIEYINYLDIIRDIKRKTTNYLNRHMNNNSIKMHHMSDYMNSTKLNSIKYPFTSKYFESKKRLFTLNDLERIFNGYNFSNENYLTQDIEDFLFNNNLIKYVALGYYDEQIDNFGYLISFLTTISNNGFDLLNNDVFDIYNTTMNIAYDGEIYNKLLNTIYSDCYCFEMMDNIQRGNLACNLFELANTKVNCSIPMLGVSNINYYLNVLDPHSVKNFELAFDTDYRVGSTGNDLLAYSITSTDSIVITISDSDHNIIGRINGIRNGNTLFLSEPIIKDNIDISDLIKAFSEQVVNYTKSSSQPIEIVLINNYDCGLAIDESTGSYIKKPIDVDSNEYLVLNEMNLLLGNDINLEFNKGSNSVVYSSISINKDSFKNYKPTIYYPRLRKEVTIINGMYNDNEINSINQIIYFYCKVNNSDYNPINIEEYKQIYLGDDYVILINYDNEITSYVLPYDERANIEVKDILTNLTQEFSKQKIL